MTADEEEALRLLARIARRLEPPIRAAFLAFLREHRRAEVWREVTRLFAEDRQAEAFRLLGAPAAQPGAEGLRRAIRDAVEQAGDAFMPSLAAAAAGTATAGGAGGLTGAALLPGPGGRPVTRVPVRLNVLHPGTLRALDGYTLGLIREIDDSVRTGIRAHLREGLRLGENPRTTARRLRDVIGLTERQQAAVRNFRRLLEAGDSAALDRALRDRRFDPTILRAIRDRRPIPPEQIDRMVERYRERMLAYRAEVIARTEALRAAGLAQHELYRQNAEAGVLARLELRRYWVDAGDERVRGSHAAAAEINADGVGMDEPFTMGSGAKLLFPRDPTGPAGETVQCRCAVIIRAGPRAAPAP